MGIIQRPVKHLGTRTYVTEVAIDPNDPILDNEVDGDLDTIYAEFNGRTTDANIDPAAGIVGSKLADASIPGSKLVNAPSLNFKTAVIPTSLSINQGAGQTVIVTLPAITTAGGLVVVGQSALGGFSIDPASGGFPEFRIFRDGILVHAVRSQQENGGAAAVGVAQPTIAFVQPGSAGPHVYDIRVEIFNAGITFGTPAINAGIAFVYELP